MLHPGTILALVQRAPAL